MHGQGRFRHERGARVRTGRRQDGRRLDPDIRRARVKPLPEVARDGCQSCLVDEPLAAGGHVQDAPRHGGVVRTLAGGEAAESATEHLRPVGPDCGTTEFVCRPQRVAGSAGEYSPACTTQSGPIQYCHDALLIKTRTGCTSSVLPVARPAQRICCRMRCPCS